MSQGQYVATRPFPTTHRQYEIGDMIDTSRITSSELNAGVTSGAIEPTKFIDTAARLAAANPVLGPGVHAYETDTGVHKIGTDGVTRYNSLSQVGSGTFAQILTPTAVKTADYTAAVGELVLANATAGGFTVTAPTGAAAGHRWGVVRTDGVTANTLTLGRQGSDTYASGTGTTTSMTVVLQDRVIIFESDGAGGWRPVEGYQALTSMDNRYGKLVEPTLLPARLLNAADGSPSLGALGGTLQAYLYDQTTNEAGFIAALVPRTVTAVAADIIWAKTAASSGNVRWRLDYKDFTNGDLGNAAFTTGTAQNVAVPSAQYELATTTLETAIPVTAGKTLGLRLYRIAGDAADTYAADAGVVGIVLRPS